MKKEETKILKIEDYLTGKFSSYRYSGNLTNPIMKKNFLINIKEKEHKFSVSDLFN